MESTLNFSPFSAMVSRFRQLEGVQKMTTRNRRQRKKMHIDEFKELGFMVKWQFPENTGIDQVDATVDAFIKDVIKPNGLAFEGHGYLEWEGLICLEKIGACTDEQRQLVQAWLEKAGMQAITVSEWFDIWWENPHFHKHN